MKVGFQDATSPLSGRKWGKKGHICSPVSCSCSKAPALWDEEKQAQAPVLLLSTLPWQTAGCKQHSFWEIILKWLFSFILVGTSVSRAMYVNRSFLSQDQHLQNTVQCSSQSDPHENESSLWFLDCSHLPKPLNLLSLDQKCNPKIPFDGIFLTHCDLPEGVGHPRNPVQIIR